VVPVTLVIENNIDRRGRSLISLIGILPPTNLAPGIQWCARYTSTYSSNALCPVKDIRTPLFERPFKKYTFSNLMVRSCVLIRNPCSATSQRPIICSSSNTSLFIFCNLKNLSKPQAHKAAHVRGLRRAAKSSISCSLSFHSIMIAEDTYKTKNQEFRYSSRFGNFDDFQKNILKHKTKCPCHLKATTHSF
jgi:hypothetical protein